MPPSEQPPGQTCGDSDVIKKRKGSGILVRIDRTHMRVPTCTVVLLKLCLIFCVNLQL